MRVNFYLDAYECSSDNLYIKIFDGESINPLMKVLGTCSNFSLYTRDELIQFKVSLKLYLEARGSAVVRIRASADGDDVVINDELAAYMSATGQELLQKLSAIRWEARCMAE